MNILLALLLQIQTSTKSFCEAHILADDLAPYAEMSNLELVMYHTAYATDEAQQELRYRVSRGMIGAREISQMKAEIEGAK